MLKLTQEEVFKFKELITVVFDALKKRGKDFGELVFKEDTEEEQHSFYDGMYFEIGGQGFEIVAEEIEKSAIVKQTRRIYLVGKVVGNYIPRLGGAELDVEFNIKECYTSYDVMETIMYMLIQLELNRVLC